MRLPTTRPVLPRISSSTSGLIFCGMIDEPVQNACGSRRKPNSVVDQRIHSSAQPLRCSAIIARQKANSRTKSRSLEASRLLATMPSKLELLGDHVAVDGDRRAGQRGGAERQLVDAAAAIGEPLAVAFELFAVGEPVVGGQHRLGPLHVGVARQDDAGVAGRPGRRTPAAARCSSRRRCVDLVADPEPQVGRDLVVAAAAGVELAADVADAVDERPLDVHVDVFELLAEGEVAGGDFLADLLQAGDDLVPFVVGEDADLGEHVGVGDRAADVLGVEPAVEAHAFGELLDAAVRRLVKHTAPRLAGQSCIRQG